MQLYKPPYRSSKRDVSEERRVPPSRYAESESPYWSQNEDAQEYNSFSEAPSSSRSTFRLVIIVLIVTLVIIGVYFYWVSREMDRISQPSILIVK